MMLGRLLMRLLVVPLGAMAAICVAVLFVIVAHWNRFAALLAAHPEAADNFTVALLFVAPVVAAVIAMSTVAMILPGALGILISEAFAIRSWVFHVANGGISAWVGWVSLVKANGAGEFYQEPLIVVGAGLTAGFAYWLVAGWNAGFWKPVFSEDTQPTTPQGRPQ
jgi:hypothetical protein